MKRVSSVLLLFILVLGLTACGKSHPVNVVKLLTDNYVIDHYTDDFPTFSNIETEIYYVSWEGGLFGSVGPTEPGYRAVVSLDKDAIDQIDEYEWTEVEEPQFTLELIDIPENQEWYMCKQFEKDKFKSVNVNYMYYNGVDTVVFDVHTY